VERVLVKPCGANVFVAEVAAVLAGVAARAPKPIDTGFVTQHLNLVTNMLARKVTELKAVNSRLSALTELNVQLASERVPRTLLEKLCSGTRALLGSRYSVLAVAARRPAEQPIFCMSGIEMAEHSNVFPDTAAGLLGRVVAERRAWRASNPDGSPVDTGLPGFPAGQALLAAPIVSLTQSFGWLCLVDKVGAAAFTAEDESMLSTLAAQAGRTYENGSLYTEVQLHAAQVLVEMEERERASQGLRASEEQFRQLTGHGPLRQVRMCVGRASQGLFFHNLAQRR
jgi:GAF domain-containing protein